MKPNFQKLNACATAEYSGDGDLVSAIMHHNNPEGIIVDADGNVYFADLNINRIVRVNAAGPSLTY